jgi:hypothetical protein
MARTVSCVHRYKRPPRQRKAIALEAGDRHHEKEPPPNWKSGGSGFFSIAPP